MNNIHLKDHKEIEAKIAEIFQKKHLRMTDTRWRIIRVFLDGDHCHTINQIKEHLARNGTNLTVATIYNNVSVLLDLGILLAFFNRAEEKACFELNVLDENIHTHFFDLDTKQYKFIENSENVNSILCEKCKKWGYKLEFGIIALNVRKDVNGEIVMDEENK